LSANNYMAAIVTDDFLQGAAWNNSRFDRITEPEATGQRQLVRLQSEIDQLTRLENKDCIQAYGTNVLQSSWKNVLVLSDANVTGPLIIGYYHRADSLTNDLGWVCGKQVSGKGNNCNTKTMLSHPSDWTITDSETNQNYTVITDPATWVDWSGNHDMGPWFEATPKYCLAETARQWCTVQISTPLLSVVLLCNLIKVLCLSSALLIRNFYPMATVGDLVSSCLSDPDPYTCGKGPIAAQDVRRSDAVRLVRLAKLLPTLLKDYRAIYFGRSTSLSYYTHSMILTVEDSSTAVDVVEKSVVKPTKWKKKEYRWYQASSMSSWAVCMILCALAWFTGVYLLTRAIDYREQGGSQTYTLSRMWQDGTYARVQIPRGKTHQMVFRPLSPSPTLPVALQSAITSNRESKEI
jgi:hypothetical protein